MEKFIKLNTFFVVSTALWVSVVVLGQDVGENTSKENPSRLYYDADTTKAKRNLDDGSVIKELKGNVKAWTQNRDSELKSDAAFYNSKLSEMRFYGNAAFRDSTRYLNADTLIYYEKRNEVDALGNVTVTETNRTFHAQRINYKRKEKLVHAYGSVKVRDDSLKASINGLEAVFNDSTNYGLIIGEPVLQKEDEGGSIITITCSDTIEIAKEDKEIRFWSNVKVIKDSLHAFANRAVYDDSTEMVTLTGTPEVNHVMYDTADDAISELRAESYATGDTMRIHLRERKVQGVDIIGNSLNKTVWTDTTDAVYARSILESANMNLLMNDNLVSLITAEGTASSYYFRNPSNDEKMYVNKATGDTLIFFYDGGKISQLRISGYGGGGAKGKYYELSPFEAAADSESVEIAVEK